MPAEVFLLTKIGLQAQKNPTFMQSRVCKTDMKNPGVCQGFCLVVDAVEGQASNSRASETASDELTGSVVAQLPGRDIQLLITSPHREGKECKAAPINECPFS